jgi:hypothetical protein
MFVKCEDLNITLEIPDVLIEKFVKDFDGLANSSHRESILDLREMSEEVIDLIYEDPEALEEPEYLADFVRALAMRQALIHHGIFYDA